MKGEPEETREKRNDESYVEYFLSECHRDYKPDTKRNFRKAWRKLREWAEEEEKDIDHITKSDAEEFADHLIESIPKETSAGLHYRNVSRVVDWLVSQTDEADRNPYEPFRKKFPTHAETKTEKLEVPIDKLRDAILAAQKFRIELFVYLVIALKTGLRAGEILNIDLRDINLDHPLSEVMPEPRTEVQNYPDTLFVDSAKEEAEEYHGEVRDASNKHKSSRKVPIDDELKSTLVWWIAMIPPTTSEARPLLRMVSSPAGKRMSRSAMVDIVAEWARDQDLNDIEMKHFGVDSHWCRHWFTTQLRANISEDEVTVGSVEGYVKGLRGDTDDDVIETYTHEWSDTLEDGKSFREVYEDNIPDLFTGEMEIELDIAG